MATVGVGVIGRGANVSDLSPNAASSGGDKVTAGRDVWLFWENTSGAPITVTVATPGTVRGLAIADLDIVVPAGGYAVRGPWPADVFGDAAGLVSLTYSTEVGLSFGAWKVGA
ncbi:hypothetical protein [Micromonospora sp. NPDC050200]|uniref:hypothetical protein n=1 Tax=Micromonospora sp. NPDC050200 TaxID=3155664 RepID=UPI0033E9429A